ncbi:unnamed protein product [Blepharisma stoltei]|uniref:Uncharacterized protein n=1 Tax=Blepharisma stoltei TaxID=1481888 RepID=A0AAU9KGK4_9CILI|nr:unnamed protein product [Blepharisma stoltei]
MDKDKSLNCYENKQRVQEQPILTTKNIRNRLSQFVDSEIQHANFKPWIAHNSEETNKGKSEDDLLFPSYKHIKWWYYKPILSRIC